MAIVRTFLGGEPRLSRDALTDSMLVVAREARTIEMRLSKGDWIVGDDYSAIDMVIFPAIQALRRALGRPVPKISRGVSCRWRSTIPLSVAGSRASSRCRVTIALSRRIGAAIEQR